MGSRGQPPLAFYLRAMSHAAALTSLPLPHARAVVVTAPDQANPPPYECEEAATPRLGGCRPLYQRLHPLPLATPLTSLHPLAFCTPCDTPHVAPSPHRATPPYQANPVVPALKLMGAWPLLSRPTMPL